jgi:spermidine synthase
MNPVETTASMRRGRGAWRLSGRGVAAGLAGIVLTVVTAIAQAETRVHIERSALQTIVVVDSETRRCLRFGEADEALNQSCVSFAAPARLEFNYSRAMVAVTLLWRPEPRRILVIGIGGGSIPMALADLLPGAQIDAVDIDPAVISVAERYFGFRPSPRLHAFAEDGREFVRRARLNGQRYDAILLDAFDSDGIPPSLFDRRFLTDVRKLLAPGGVFLANTFAASPSYAAESATAEAVFGPFLNIKLGRDTTGNRLLAAGTDRLPAPATLMQVPASRRAAFERIGASDEWLESWRFAGRDWGQRR